MIAFVIFLIITVTKVGYPSQTAVKQINTLMLCRLSADVRYYH